MRSAERPRIRAVFFDIGNVLLWFNARTFIAHIARITGRSPLAIVGRFWKDRVAEKLDRGAMTPNQFIEFLDAKLGYKESRETFDKAWCDFALNREVEAVFNDVRRRHKAYLLSNTNALHYDFIRRHYAFARRAHGTVLSFRLGLRKPEPDIYRAALERARVPAQEAAFIDDLKENVAAAERLGIQTVLYKKGVYVRARLTALGLEL